VANVPDGDCTTYAISGSGTAAGQLLIGQNSDMGEEHYPHKRLMLEQPV
jgi:hypothetical protein